MRSQIAKSLSVDDLHARFRGLLRLENVNAIRMFFFSPLPFFHCETAAGAS